MAKILIKQCPDTRFWYRDKIGQTLPLIGEDGEFYWSIEYSERCSFKNIVKKEDAEILEANAS